MRYGLDIQTLASLSFVGTFAAAECAAWQLHAHPTSPLAWQLNFGVFRAFEYARTGAHAAPCLFAPASLPVALTLIVVIVAVRALQNRFAVALFANLSFVGSLMLCYAVVSEKSIYRATVTPAALLQDTQVVLVAALAAASFLGFAVSHWSFLRAMSAAVQTPAIPKRRERLVRSWSADERWRPSTHLPLTLWSLRAERGGSAAHPNGQGEYC